MLLNYRVMGTIDTIASYVCGGGGLIKQLYRNVSTLLCECVFLS